MEANIVIWGAMIIAILFLIAYRKRDKKPPKSIGIGVTTVKAESYCPKCGRFPETSVLAKPVENFKGGISVNFRKHCIHCGMIFDGKIHYVTDLMDAINFNSEFVRDWESYCEKYKGDICDWNDYCEKYKGEK